MPFADRIVGEERKDLYSGLLVVLIALLVYANSLGNGFVWDDNLVIRNNPALDGNIVHLFSGIDIALELEKNPYYRPLTISTFLIEKRLHGHTPLLMHLFNILFHAANAFLIYRLAFTLVSNRYAALLTGLLFAVHPINTECVDFISARNTILAGFFILASYLMHEQSIRQGKNIKAAAGAALFFAGLFSKETTIAVLPFIVFLEIASLRGADFLSRRRSFARLVPYFLCAVFYLILRNSALSHAGVRLEIFPGLLDRLLDNIYIIPSYLLNIICPIALSPIYSVPDDLNILVLPLLTGWLCIIGIIGWLLTKGRTPATLFGLAWLIAFWLPVSGIVYFPSAQMADRHLYLPAIGMWLILADQAVRMLPAGNRADKYGIIAAMLILLLAGLTIKRNMDWKSEITLFSRVVEQYPNDARGHAELGRSYYKEDRNNNNYLDMSEREFNKALALDPSMQTLHTPIGSIRLVKGDYEGALFHYTEALSADPFDKEALIYRGMVLENLKRYKEAAADYQLFLYAPGKGLDEMRSYAEERVRELSQ